MNRKARQEQDQISNEAGELAVVRRSLADALTELRQVRGDEEPIEEVTRADRPNGFTPALGQLS